MTSDQIISRAALIDELRKSFNRLQSASKVMESKHRTFTVIVKAQDFSEKVIELDGADLGAMFYTDLQMAIGAASERQILRIRELAEDIARNEDIEVKA